MAARLYVVSIDSTREVDLARKRIRRIEGIRPPTEREGDRSWRKYLDLRPNPPIPGQGLVVVWGYDGEVVKTTQTSATVASFTIDPTVGPWGWWSLDGGSGGGVTDGDHLILTPTVEAAHVLAALANAALANDGFSDPEPPWEIWPLPDEVAKDWPESTASLRVSGAVVALGESDALIVLGEALAKLPPDPNMAFGTIAAANPNASGWAAASVSALGPRVKERSLTAAGLTDAEIASAPIDELAALAVRTGHRMPWGSVGRWLRAPHPALAGRSPLEVVAAGDDVEAAAADPFSGGDPPREEWEAEAWAAFEAARAEELDDVKLERDPTDGCWMVSGIYAGVQLAVAETRAGIFGAAQLHGSGPDVWVVTPRAVEPSMGPAELVKLTDEWLATGEGAPCSKGHR